MKRVLVIVDAGFEEIETAAVVDVLRRAGVEVTLAGRTGTAPLRGARGLVVVPDAAFDPDWQGDLVVLPGGMANAEALAADPRVLDLLRTRVYSGQPVAAICAAPLALDAAGVLPAGGWTCYPGVEARFTAVGRVDEPVAEYAGVITSQGPGTAIRFALYLAERLVGRAAVAPVAEALLVGRTAGAN